MSTDNPLGYDKGFILINEDGTFVRRIESVEDLGGRVENAEVVELLSPESYGDCLLLDDAGRFDCLAQTLDVVEVCQQGWVIDLSGEG